MNRLLVPLLLLFVGAAQLTPGLYAAVNQWTGAIPLKVTSIRFHPGRPALMYLATDTGLYSTEDEGRTVTALNNGLPYTRITGFELDPSNPSLLYVVSQQGLFRSDNAGRDWHPMLTWDHTWQEARLAIDPQNGQALYLVTVDRQIKKTSDGGKTWNGLPLTGNVSCLAVSPSEPEVLYAGSTQGIVSKTTNSGTDWRVLSDTVAHGGVQSLVVDPRNPDTVYKSADDAGWRKSTDGGLTWKQVEGLSRSAFLFICPNDPNAMFSGSSTGSNIIYRSLDGGASWDEVPRSLEKELSLITASPDGQALFAAGKGRLYKSIDNGVNWISTIPTIEEIGPAELVVHPEAPDTMYAFYRTGVSRTIDGGITWRHFGPGLPGGYVTDLEIDPRNTRSFFVGVEAEGVFKNDGNGDTWQPILIDNEAVDWQIQADPIRAGCIFAIGHTMSSTKPPHAYRTMDAGRTWARIDPGPDARFIWYFVFDPVTAGAVYMVAGGGSGVYKSTNGGDTWSPRPNPPPPGSGGVAVLAIDPRNPRTLYCTSSDFMFRSTDGGDNWSWLGGPGSGLPDSERIHRLIVSPHDSTVYAFGTVYAGTGSIYRSTDSGSHWNAMPERFPWPTFSPQNPDVLFGVKTIWPHFEETVIKSTNAGASWYPLHFDLRFAFTSRLRIDPTDSNIVFALAYQDGVYKSTDGTRSWARASEGLTANLSVMEIDPSKHHTLFTAGDDGVFQTNDSGQRWERISEVPMSSLAFDPHTSGLIYGISQWKLCKSTDGGRSWNEIAPDFFVAKLAVSHSDPNVIYAGGYQVLIKSTDAGATWAQLDWAFEAYTITGISIHPADPSAVRVSVYDSVPFESRPGGAYESLDGGLSWREITEYPPVYPDPLTPNIVYSNSRVSLDGGSTWLDLPTPSNRLAPTFSPTEPRKGYVGIYGVFAVSLSQEKTSYFPQIGTGRAGAGELQTELVFMNLGTESQVELEFAASDGQPMPVSLDQSGLQSSHSIAICGGCTVAIKTVDTSGLRTGYARVRSGINVHGTAVYGYSEDAVRLFEAGVPSVTGLQNATIFVNRSQAGKDTGVAIANVGEEAADVTLRLYDPSFKPIASRKLDVVLGAPLEAGAHAARFLTELFGSAAEDLEDGIVTVESDQPLAITSLLQGRSPESFPLGNVTLTAMPVLAGRADGASPPFIPVPRKLHVPQIGNGRAGSLQLQSSLLLTNLDRGSASVRVEFFDSAGQPMPLPLASQGAQSLVSLTLRSGQSCRITTDGSGPVQAGYAVVTAAANLGVAAVYHCFDGGVPMFEAGVPAVSRHSKYVLFGSVTPSTDTAVALINAGTKAAHGAITFYDAEGKSLGSRSLESVTPLAPGVHIAQYLSELFPEVTAENGRVVIESDQPLAGVTLRQRDDPALAFPFEVYLLTVFPAVPIP